MVNPAKSAFAKIRILVADDHAIVRAGLRQFIADEPDMEVAGEAETGLQVIAMVRSDDWDVVLLDISMPELNGIDTLKRLKQIKPDLPVLILSAFSEQQYAVNLMHAGASGYINKESAPNELVAAVRAATRGQKYISAALAQILANDLGAGQDHTPLHSHLSTREFQIFCRLAAGGSVSVIAEQINLSVKTVSTYRSRVLEKMNMKTNAELTYYAIKNQLIQ
jgi:DNA-binding NarL/FixJ family response regulator